MNDIEWRIENALSALYEAKDRIANLAPAETDHLREIRHTQITVLEYAIEVVKGITTIEPPHKPGVREKLREGRDLVTDGIASTLEDLSYWFKDFKHD